MSASIMIIFVLTTAYEQAGDWKALETANYDDFGKFPKVVRELEASSQKE